ncbi:MAG: oligopeptide/dipeptide ABC transporter ATP-binding protein [Pseudomonadota bacterium]
MTAPVLELREVSKVFQVRQGLFRSRKPLRAVDAVSLSLGKGEVLGLVGESGCGKSTLAQLLLGLERPTSGEVLIDGQPMTGADQRALARRIQPIFQDPYSSLNPRKSISAIVGLPLEVHGIGSPADRARQVAQMLSLVGLPSRVADSYPSQLSGGQRQRVAIARALIMRPEVVVCDEPTSALDVSVQSQILNLLMDLRDELGLTYLLISHDLAVVEHIATRVAVMYLGRIVEMTAAREIFRTPRHPYSEALLQSVLTPDPGLGVPDTHLGAVFPNPIDPPSGCAFHPRCAKALGRCAQQRPPRSEAAGAEVECWLSGEIARAETAA